MVFQQSLLDPSLTVRENLMSRARMYGISSQTAADRINILEKLIDLDFLDSPRYGKLSGGQKRRADIARALIHNPTILFLDEPTAGLDPASRQQVWKTIHSLKDTEGMTVFLTTHYMEETEQSQQLCIIDSGKIIAEGIPHELRKRYSKNVLSVQVSDKSALSKLCKEQELELKQLESDNIFQILVDSSDQARFILENLGSGVKDFEFVHGTMDDVFLALTGKKGNQE